MTIPAQSVLFVVDPLSSLKPAKDTSLGLAREAQQRGYACFAAQVEDLSLRDGVAWGRVQAFSVSADAQPLPAATFSATPLSAFRWILMRKDPPVDAAYIWATMLMERAAGPSTTVLNAPTALRNHNEKLSIARFASFCAPTLTSARMDALRAFAKEQGDVVVKPLDGMGGRSIFRLRADDPNLNVVLETLTDNGRRLAMAQTYLPAITQGDKRILMIRGQPWPRVLARLPAQGESRGNLAAGGRGVVQDLSPADAAIAAAVGPWLVEQGVVFAGLDVIGDRLTEINITSPTCVREIEAADGSQICAALWDAFEASGPS